MGICKRSSLVVITTASFYYAEMKGSEIIEGRKER